MKSIKVGGLVLLGYVVGMQQAFAQVACGIDDLLPCEPNGVVPEIDGSGAIIAIGLVVGLVALIREKFYR